jgi:hypothetical protein
MKFETLSEDVLRRQASIIGPHSAAARALEEIKRRRADGQDVEVVRCGSTIMVFEKPDAPDSDKV